eukprot:m.313316 g.313316  ORF g.313316 m.313316 type:complete len:208 (-) comp16488_c0_seq7:2510-3133(-)
MASEADLTASDFEKQSKKISKAKINELPLISWKGDIRVLETKQSMEEAVRELQGEKHLGFDTETRPAFKKGQFYPPSLIQLATETCVYLFRINKTKTLAPLLPLLESPDIIKTGVGIEADVKELLVIQRFKPAGFIEVTDVTSELGYENKGLRALAALLLGGRVSKGAQMTNWARAELEQRQIRYAATDAWISRELYSKAIEERDAS